MISILLLALACTSEPEETGVSSLVDTSADDTASDDTGALSDLSWDGACNPFGMADDCLTPFPSALYTVEDAGSPTGLRLDYQAEDFSGPDGALPVDPAIFNAADGASPIGYALINLGRDVHDDQLSHLSEEAETIQPGAPIALLDVETGQPVLLMTEMDQNNRDMGYDGRHALILRPVEPLRMGARYLAVLGNDLMDVDGQPFESPPVFAALRDGEITGDAGIEALRTRYDETLFPAAEAAGWAREDLLVAWEFQVASEEWTLGAALDMKAQSLALIADEGVPYTIDSVEIDPNENVGWLIRGSFQPPNFLTEDNELVRTESGGVVLQDDRERPAYPFTALIPPQAGSVGPMPLVVLGHGIFGEGEGYLTGGTGEDIVQPLSAQLGAVIVATDWIGLSGGDLELIIAEVVTDLARIRLVTDRLGQSLVNNLALPELFIQGLPADAQIGLPADLIDPEAVYYYGVSLGGVQGSSYTALSDRVSRSVLAVPGAGWSTMIQRSVHFEQIELLIDLLYADPLAQTTFISMLQSAFDVSDPGNLATLLRDDTSGDRPVVLLQEAMGDCQVPNVATDILVRAMGVAHLQEATDPIYGLDTIDSPATDPALTQIRMPDAMAEYMPPDENTLPTQNNDVHSDAIRLDPAIEQIAIMMSEGVSAHTCDGACDPD